MVGSGGVGKSALTLQFMYDEVRLELRFPSALPSVLFLLLSHSTLVFARSSWRTTSPPKPTATGRRWCWTARTCRLTFWTRRVKKTTQPSGITISAVARASCSSSPSQSTSHSQQRRSSGQCVSLLNKSSHGLLKAEVHFNSFMSSKISTIIHNKAVKITV